MFATYRLQLVTVTLATAWHLSNSFLL